MTEQMDLFGAGPNVSHSAVSLEATRLVGREGLSISAALDALLPAFGSTVEPTTILDVVMTASRRGRAVARRKQ